MKFKILLLLIFSSQFCSAQFFENVMDVILYDKQDSLVRQKKVKVLKIEIYNSLKKDEFKGVDIREYDKLGLLMLRRETGFFLFSTKYIYDEFNRLVESKTERKERKIDFENSQIVGGIHHITSSIPIKNKSKKKRFKYDSLGRVMNEKYSFHKSFVVNGKSSFYKLNYKKMFEDRFGNEKRYFYLKDTLKVIHYNKKVEELGFIEIIENTDNKKRAINNDETVKLKFIKKTYEGKGLIRKNDFYISSNGWIVKEVNTSVFQLNRDVKQKIFSKTTYRYSDEGSLINSETKGFSSSFPYSVVIIEYEYFENGLLKRIITSKKNKQSKEFEKVKEEKYTYEFHKN